MQPAVCINSHFFPDRADRSQAASSSLSVKDASHEKLETGRREHQQGCEGAACYSMGIERIGNCSRDRPYSPGDSAFGGRPGAESR